MIFYFQNKRNLVKKNIKNTFAYFYTLSLTMKPHYYTLDRRKSKNKNLKKNILDQSSSAYTQSMKSKYKL